MGWQRHDKIVGGIFAAAVAVFVACFAIDHVGAQAPVIGQGGAAPVVPLFSQGSHNYTAGPLPTISGCGVSTGLAGDDNAGTVTPVATTCTITFQQAWPATPFCTVNASATAPTFTVSPSAITVSVTVSGVPLVWQCIGRLG